MSGRVLQEILVQAGLAEAHHRLRTFKASVSQEVQETSNTEDTSVSWMSAFVVGLVVMVMVLLVVMVMVSRWEDTAGLRWESGLWMAVVANNHVSRRKRDTWKGNDNSNPYPGGISR